MISRKPRACIVERIECMQCNNAAAQRTLLFVSVLLMLRVACSTLVANTMSVVPA